MDSYTMFLFVLMFLFNLQIGTSRDEDCSNELTDLKLKYDNLALKYEKLVTYMEGVKMQIDKLSHSENKRLLIPASEPNLHIAFDAKLSGTRDHTGHADVVIVFDDVLTNKGNAYQNDIGVFTAPVSGTYLFAWTIRGSGASNTVTSLYVNAEKKMSTHTDGSGQPIFVPSSSKVAILNLQNGDHVMIKTIGIYQRGVIYSDSNGHSSFAGTLLFQN